MCIYIFNYIHIYISTVCTCIFVTSLFNNTKSSQIAGFAFHVECNPPQTQFISIYSIQNHCGILWAVFWKVHCFYTCLCYWTSRCSFDWSSTCCAWFGSKFLLSFKIGVHHVVERSSPHSRCIELAMDVESPEKESLFGARPQVCMQNTKDIERLSSRAEPVETQNHYGKCFAYLLIKCVLNVFKTYMTAQTCIYRGHCPFTYSHMYRNIYKKTSNREESLKRKKLGMCVVLRGVHGSRGMFACTFACEDAVHMQTMDDSGRYADISIHTYSYSFM